MAELTPELLKALAEQFSSAQTTSASIEAVLAKAPDIGVEEALKQYGKGLSEAEQQLILNADPQDLADLKRLKEKLGPIGARAAHVNNNNL